VAVPACLVTLSLVSTVTSVPKTRANSQACSAPVLALAEVQVPVLVPDLTSLLALAAILLANSRASFQARAKLRFQLLSAAVPACQAMLSPASTAI
jgi:hypothetical protein